MRSPPLAAESEKELMIVKCRNCGRPRGEGEGWERRTGSILSVHTTCPEEVCKKPKLTARGPWGSPVCSRDAVEETPDGWLCRRHLNQYNQQVEKDRVALQMAVESGVNYAKAYMALRRLKPMGIRGVVHYDSDLQMYTGQVVVDPMEILERLKEPAEDQPIPTVL